MPQVNLEHVHEDIVALRRDVEMIKDVLAEERELSEEAKRKLRKARNASDEEFAPHEDVVDRFT
jgi:hypothetical protein